MEGLVFLAVFSCTFWAGLIIGYSFGKAKTSDKSEEVCKCCGNLKVECDEDETCLY